jgi:DNA processing protein
MHTEETLYRIALTRLPGIGAVHTKRLIERFGDATGVFRANERQLRMPGLRPESIQAILEFREDPALKTELQWLEQKAVRLLFFTDPDYPKRLLAISDAPPLLFYRGNADLNASRIVSVVGTRAASEYGKRVTAQLLGQLAQTGAIVISGLALGIDAAAHSAALANRLPTVAVLAHGLSTIYPPQHWNMAKTMISAGGLLTTFRHDIRPERHHFPDRNRLVAGLCDALIVVETAKKGGSMVTAAHARQLGKKIFAVPGRLTDHRSAGCNWLIEHGIARLLTSGDQLSAAMGWQWATGTEGRQSSLIFDQQGTLTGSPEDRVLQHLRGKESLSLDELLVYSQLDPGTLALTLLNLEVTGSICNLRGKRYSANTVTASA